MLLLGQGSTTKTYVVASDNAISGAEQRCALEACRGLHSRLHVLLFNVCVVVSDNAVGGAGRRHALEACTATYTACCLSGCSHSRDIGCFRQYLSIATSDIRATKIVL